MYSSTVDDITVSNSRWLGRLRGVSAQEWNWLTGLVTGLGALLLVMPAVGAATSGRSSSEWLAFAGVVSGVAILVRC